MLLSPMVARKAIMLFLMVPVRKVIMSILRKPRAGEMAQLLKILSTLPEDPGFDSQHPHSD